MHTPYHVQSQECVCSSSIIQAVMGKFTWHKHDYYSYLSAFAIERLLFCLEQ